MSWVGGVVGDGEGCVKKCILGVGGVGSVVWWVGWSCKKRLDLNQLAL